MKKFVMIMLLFAFSITTLNVAAQSAPVSEEYKKELTKYYRLSGSDASISVAVDGMMQMINNIPEANKLNLKKEVFENLIREMIEMLAPIYEKNISLADLKAMNKFYESEAGKRIAAAMPTITKESMVSAMSMGTKMQKIMEDAMKNQQQQQ